MMNERSSAVEKIVSYPRRCERVEAGATIFCIAQKKADGSLTAAP
jgi:hypothetical protein